MRLNGRTGKLQLAFGGASLLAVILAGWSQKPSQAQPTRQRGRQEKFRNVKVLKNLTHDQLIATMRTYSGSLGVRCDFCHVRDFASDQKPEKRTARSMILMMNNINAHQKILDNQATCYMCHHGQPSPETRLPEQPGREPGQPARPAPGQS
ncbi:MAG TPA: c-type cytochrome [Chthonomonadales bacterium]|nr:c-type cytochrome [Chthonomonadales bacterium]